MYIDGSTIVKYILSNYNINTVYESNKFTVISIIVFDLFNTVATHTWIHKLMDTEY